MDLMAIAKFELHKFNGDNDFNMWRIKMKALLVDQGMYSALVKQEGTIDEDGKKSKNKFM